MTKSEIENMDFDGKVLMIAPEGDTLMISVEREEDVDAEFTSEEAE